MRGYSLGMPQRTTARPIRIDSTVSVLREGYAFLPNRRAGADVLPLRVLGRSAVAVCGREWARLFYDQDRFERSSALPGPVLSTLVGHGAVHTLDDAAHRHRKAMFMSVMTSERIAELVSRTASAWHEHVQQWARQERVVLFDAAADVLLQGMWQWCGLPTDRLDVRREAADMLAMVDGFATPGPRHWRARLARRRQDAHVTSIVEEVRSGRRDAPDGSPLALAATYRDDHGGVLPAHTAAVELLNLVRPTVAVTWFLAFGAHALHRWPQHRKLLTSDDAQQVTAFQHEVRRFYPFAPFLGAVARRDMSWHDVSFSRGDLVLLDVFGQHHDGSLWPDPFRFEPGRFVGRDIDPYELVPQGGGDPATGHRCPGEWITIALLEDLLVRLAHVQYDVPEQDLRISLARVPAKPASGFVVTGVRA